MGFYTTSVDLYCMALVHVSRKKLLRSLQFYVSFFLSARVASSDVPTLFAI